MKGLIIKSPWIDMILDGKKTWEIRGNNTKIRGPIALIKSGSGHIFGMVELVDSHPLTLEKYKESAHLHQVASEHCVETPYKNTHAWEMRNPVLFDEPVPYEHPQGAVIWVNLRKN